MAELTIITNNVPRDILEAYELTPKEREEFDYLDWKKIEQGEDSASFFRYKDEVYDLGEFEALRNSLSAFYDNFGTWHGIQTDSFFSGILVRYTEDNEQVVVGRYYT